MWKTSNIKSIEQRKRTKRTTDKHMDYQRSKELMKLMDIFAKDLRRDNENSELYSKLSNFRKDYSKVLKEGSSDTYDYLLKRLYFTLRKLDNTNEKIYYTIFKDYYDLNHKMKNRKRDVSTKYVYEYMTYDDYYHLLYRFTKKEFNEMRRRCMAFENVFMTNFAMHMCKKNIRLLYELIYKFNNAKKRYSKEADINNQEKQYLIIYKARLTKDDATDYSFEVACSLLKESLTMKGKWKRFFRLFIEVNEYRSFYLERCKDGRQALKVDDPIAKFIY